MFVFHSALHKFYLDPDTGWRFFSFFFAGVSVCFSQNILHCQVLYVNGVVPVKTIIHISSRWIKFLPVQLSALFVKIVSSQVKSNKN